MTDSVLAFSVDLLVVGILTFWVKSSAYLDLVWD